MLTVPVKLEEPIMVFAKEFGITPEELLTTAINHYLQKLTDAIVRKGDATAFQTDTDPTQQDHQTMWNEIEKIVRGED